MKDNDDLLSKMQNIASDANSTTGVTRRKTEQPLEDSTDVLISEYDKPGVVPEVQHAVVEQTSNSNFNSGERDSSDVIQTINDKPAVKSTTTVDDIDFEKLLENFDDIKIIDSGIQATRTINTYINNKPTYNVVALQSGYEAKLSALTMVDKASIRNSTDTPHAVRRKLYEIVYNHIEGMSVVKPSFEEWLKITSYWDVETLLFGIYAQTYSHNNSFDITCSNCEAKNRVRVDAEALVQIRDEDAYEQVRSIISSVTNFTELKGRSQVGKNVRFVLPKSKIIVIAKSPSLYEHLNMLKSYNPAIPAVGEVFAFSLFIKELLVPNYAEISKGNMEFARVTGRDDIHQIVTRMDSEDEDHFNEKVSELSDKFKIEFCLNKFNCVTPGCGKEFDQIPLDIESLLFFRILGGQK